MFAEQETLAMHEDVGPYLPVVFLQQPPPLWSAERYSTFALSPSSCECVDYRVHYLFKSQYKFEVVHISRTDDYSSVLI